MQEFRDRVAFVTGGARGIGLGIARALLDEGARVMLADVHEAALADARFDALSSEHEAVRTGLEEALARLVAHDAGLNALEQRFRFSAADARSPLPARSARGGDAPSATRISRIGSASASRSDHKPSPSRMRLDPAEIADPRPSNASVARSASRARSTSATSTPARASPAARHKPAMPPPTIATSASRFSIEAKMTSTTGAVQTGGQTVPKRSNRGQKIIII